MKFRVFSVFSLAILASVVAAQSVTITPRKQTYRRPRPIADFKKTFSIRRPVAKAATAALSRKITSAIDPVSVLDINLKEELGSEQWLEEADYKILYNRGGVLSVECWMEGTAAYPDSVTKHVVVNLTNGTRVRPSDIFTDLQGLARVVKRIQTNEVKNAIAEMRKDPELKDPDPAGLFTDTDFTVKDLNNFSVTGNGVTFYYGYGFPHVIQAAEPPGEYVLNWTQLRPFVKRDGLLGRFIR